MPFFMPKTDRFVFFTDRFYIFSVSRGVKQSDMNKEIRKADLMYVTEFANIMSVSRPTIKNWLKKGYLNEVRRKSNDRGVQFHIFDVFQFAHPNADKNTIEIMIFEYRQQKTKQILQNQKLRAKRGVKSK